MFDFKKNISNYSAEFARFGRAFLEFAIRFKSGYTFLNISTWLGAFKNIFLTVDINLPTFINFDHMVSAIPY
jgi:hypothetical protein